MGVVTIVVGKEGERSGGRGLSGPVIVTVAAGLVGVAVGVALLALLNRYVLGVRGDEAPEGDWPDRDDADDATVELIYEHTKDSPSDQLHDSEQLDTKTTAVFAAATVAIGLAGRLPANGRLVELCVYLAVGLWASTALATVLVVRTRSFHRTLQADDLYPQYSAQ